MQRVSSRLGRQFPHRLLVVSLTLMNIIKRLSSLHPFSCGPDSTMFRIVVKSNLTMSLAHNLVKQFEFTLPSLDSLQAGYASMHSAKLALQLAEKMPPKPGQNKAVAAVNAIMAARKWSANRRKSTKILGLDVSMLEELEIEEQQEGEGGKEVVTDKRAIYAKARRHRGSVHQVC
jgi:hypothetical protein